MRSTSWWPSCVPELITRRDCAEGLGALASHPGLTAALEMDRELGLSRSPWGLLPPPLCAPQRAAKWGLWQAWGRGRGRQGQGAGREGSLTRARRVRVGTVVLSGRWPPGTCFLTCELETRRPGPPPWAQLKLAGGEGRRPGPTLALWDSCQLPKEGGMVERARWEPEPAPSHPAAATPPPYTGLRWELMEPVVLQVDAVTRPAWTQESFPPACLPSVR